MLPLLTILKWMSMLLPGSQLLTFADPEVEFISISQGHRGQLKLNISIKSSHLSFGSKFYLQYVQSIYFPDIAGHG